MVERRELNNIDLTNAPEIDLLTINQGMREQKLAERLDRVENSMNKEPLPILVKDEKEATSVKKLEEKLENPQDWIAENQEEVKQDVKEMKDNAQEKVQDWKNKGEEKMQDWKENAQDKIQDWKEKGQEWQETIADRASDIKDKMQDWSEDAKETISNTADQAKTQVRRLDRQIRESNWWHDQYMWVFVGVVVAGTSYLVYKSFYG
jgi:ElaB/YqjD/DUF883 family membrane-anchored ribosome-binding protein